MARKKETQFKTGNIKFDSDLDFNFDDSFDIIDPVKQSKKRTPIQDVVKGTTSGIKRTVKTASFWDNLARNALPSSYKVISDEVKQTRDTLSSIYNESVHTLKPELNRIGRQVDNLVPSEFSRLKRLTAKLSPSETRVAEKISAEALQNQAIEQSQNDIFNKLNESALHREARDRSERRVKDQIDSKRFHAHSNILGNIAENIAKNTSYTISINSAYQKKSLELQYRSFYVQSEILAGQTKYFDVFKAYLESIKHNSALPDFVKATHSEQFKQASLNRLFTAGSTKLSAGLGRAAKRARNAIINTKDYLQNVNSGLEAFGQLQEFRRTARELGLGESVTHDIFEGLSSIGTQAAGGAIGKRLSKFIKPGSRLSKGLATGSRFITDPTSFIDKLQNSKRYNKLLTKGGIVGGATEIFDLLLGDFKSQGHENELTNNNASAGKLAPYFFSNRAHTSLVDVIPGLLSRILQEQTAIRLGTKQLGQLQIYDYKSGRFTTSSKFRKESKKEIIDTHQSSQVNRKIESFAKAITGKNLDPEQNKRIKNFSYDLLANNPKLNIISDEIFNTKEFSKLNNEDKDLIRKQHGRFTNTEEGKDALAYIKSQISEGINSHIALIQSELAERIKNGEAPELLKARLIKPNRNGGFDLNRPVVTRLIRSVGLNNPIRREEEKKRFIDKIFADKNKKEVKINFGFDRDDFEIPKSNNSDYNPTDNEPKTSNANNNFKSAVKNKLSNYTNKLKVKSYKIVNDITTKLDKPIDLYLPNGTKPVLVAEDFDKGKYFDRNNKPVKTMQDIKNSSHGIYNENGDMIVSPSQLLKGLYTYKGVKVKFSLAKARDLGNRTKSNLNSTIDKLKDKVKPYTDYLLEPTVSQPSNQGQTNTQAPQEQYTENVSQGNPFGGIKDLISGANKYTTKENANKLLDKAKILSGKLSNTKTGKRINNIKNLLTSGANRFNKTKIGNKLSGLGSNLARAGTSFYQNLNSNENKDPNFVGPKEPDITSKAGIRNLFSKAKDKLTSLPIGQSINNNLQKASRRAGDFRTRLEELAQRDAEKKAEQSNRFIQGTEPDKYRDKSISEGGGVFNLLKGFTGFLSGSLGRLFNFATGTFSVIGKVSNLLFNAGKLATSGVGSLIKGGSAVGRVLSTVGSPIAKVIARTGATGAGRLASGLFTGLRVAAGVGATLVPGIGGIALSGISAGLSLLGAALTSPVFLGAAAIGAVAYGGYKLYKYLSRDNLDKYQKFRYMQYGFGTHETESYNHKLANLENYLISGKVTYEKTLEDKYIAKFKSGQGAPNPEQIFRTFEIDPNSEQATAFARWYKNRFTPFFLNTLTALHNSNNKATLFNIDKLTIDERTNFLKAAIFEEGPYNEIESPIAEIHSLTSNKQEVTTYVNGLITSINKVPKNSGARGSFAREHKAQLDNNRKDTLANIKDARKDAVKTAKDTSTAANIAALKLDADKQKLTKPIDSKTLSPPDNTDQETSDLGKANSGKFVNNKDKTTINPNINSLVVAGGDILGGNGASPYLKLKDDSVKLDGLNDSVLKNFLGMVEEYGNLTGKSITVNSAYRSFEDQQTEYNKNPNNAAKPGNSLHNFGLALDIKTTDANALEEAGLMRKYGFTRPVGGEPWHIEPAGLQGNIAAAKKDPNLATQLTDASLGKGGGGLALVPGADKRSRNTNLQLALLNASASVSNVEKDNSKLLASNNPNFDKINKVETALNSFKLSPPEPTNINEYKRQQEAKRQNNTAIPDPNQSLTNNARYSIDTTNINADNEPMPYGESTDSNKQGDSFPVNMDGIKMAINDFSKIVGAPAKDLQVIGAVESGLNNQSNASVGTAQGVFQFTDPTWRYNQDKYGKKFGLTGMETPQNVKASTIFAGINYNNNLDSVKRIVPNAGLTEAYLAHFLGKSGAHAFLTSNPDQIADTIFPKAARSNPNIFYTNGKALTIGEVYSKVSDRLQTAARDFNISGVSINKRFPQASVSNAVFKPDSQNDEVTKIPSVRVTPTINNPVLNNIENKQEIKSIPRRELSAQTTLLPVRNTRQNNIEVDTPMREMVEAANKSINIQQKSLETLIDIRDMMKVIIESRTKENNIKPNIPLTSTTTPKQTSEPITPIVNIGRVRSFNS